MFSPFWFFFSMKASWSTDEVALVVHRQGVRTTCLQDFVEGMGLEPAGAYASGARMVMGSFVLIEGK